MLILIPPSEGKAKVKSSDITFGETKFKFENSLPDTVCQTRKSKQCIRITYFHTHQKY